MNVYLGVSCLVQLNPSGEKVVMTEFAIAAFEGAPEVHPIAVVPH